MELADFQTHPFVSEESKHGTNDSSYYAGKAISKENENKREGQDKDADSVDSEVYNNHNDCTFQEVDLHSDKEVETPPVKQIVRDEDSDNLADSSISDIEDSDSLLNPTTPRASNP